MVPNFIFLAYPHPEKWAADKNDPKAYTHLKKFKPNKVND